MITNVVHPASRLAGDACTAAGVVVVVDDGDEEVVKNE